MKSAHLLAILLTSCLVAILAACLLGSTPMGLSQVFKALLGQSTAGDNIVVWEIRLPRALAAFVVGAALGASGAALQGLLRNPLAEPGVLGVTATSSLSATFALYYGFAATSPLLLPVYAIAGALLATALLAAAAVREVRRNAHPHRCWPVQFFGVHHVPAAEPGAQPVFAG